MICVLMFQLSSVLCYNVLCSSVLYSTVLCCSVLCSNVLMFYVLVFYVLVFYVLMLHDLRDQNNARSSTVFATCLVINFPSFNFCPLILWRKNWKLFSSFLGFKEIYQWSRNNEPKIIMCVENQIIDNRIIPPYKTGTLKHLMHIKLGHVLNDDKYYCLFFTYTKQLTLSSYMTLRKTLHIKSWTRLFRWHIYWSLDHQICTLSS